MDGPYAWVHKLVFLSPGSIWIAIVCLPKMSRRGAMSSVAPGICALNVSSHVRVSRNTGSTMAVVCRDAAENGMNPDA